MTQATAEATKSPYQLKNEARAAKIGAIAEKIAAALGHAYTATPGNAEAWNGAAEISDTVDRYTVASATHTDEVTRLEISYNFPRELHDFKSYDFDYKSQLITVAADKAPAKIAADITRRLLPQCRDERIKRHERRENRDKMRAQSQEIAERITAAAPRYRIQTGELDRGEERRDSHDTGRKLVLKTSSQTCIQIRSESADLEINAAPFELAEQIAALVSNYYDARDHRKALADAKAAEAKNREEFDGFANEETREVYRLLMDIRRDELEKYAREVWPECRNSWNAGQMLRSSMAIKARSIIGETVENVEKLKFEFAAAHMKSLENHAVFQEIGARIIDVFSAEKIV